MNSEERTSESWGTLFFVVVLVIVASPLRDVLARDGVTWWMPCILWAVLLAVAYAAGYFRDTSAGERGQD